MVQRWSRGAELVLRCRCVCRSSAEVVHRCCRAGRGQVQMCKIDAKVGAGVQVQRCRGGAAVQSCSCRGAGVELQRDLHQGLLESGVPGGME